MYEKEPHQIVWEHKTAVTGKSGVSFAFQHLTECVLGEHFYII